MSAIMKGPPFSFDETVVQVVRKYPDTTPVFISLGMNCVGCCLMRFCTLEYGARSHHIDPETLLKELGKVAGNSGSNAVADRLRVDEP